MQRWQQMGLLGPLGLVRRVVSLTRRHSESVAGGRTLSKNGQSRLCPKFSMQKKMRHQHEVAAFSRKLTHARLPKKTIFPGAACWACWAWWRAGVLAVCLLARTLRATEMGGLSIAGVESVDVDEETTTAVTKGETRRRRVGSQCARRWRGRRRGRRGKQRTCCVTRRGGWDEARRPEF